jgi:flagellar hook-basal body complex protein FliE
MRINPFDFNQLTMSHMEKNQNPSTNFVDTLKDAVIKTNEKAQKANKVAVELAEGKTSNIHEAMITMQKADISIRMLISVTNKLIDGYKQLTQLR